MVVDPSVIAKALAARMADVEVAVDRYGSFVHRPGAASSPPALAEGEVGSGARDLVLRTLGALADPVNHQLLRRLADGDTHLPELADLVGLPRLALWERVNDLMQVGLVGHALEEDRAGLTAAGDGLMGMVDDLVAGIVAESTR